jgi:hypothetical protein
MLVFVFFALLAIVSSARAQEPATAGPSQAGASIAPLSGKTCGVEFSPIRLLWAKVDPSMGKSIQLSGGFSLFALDTRAEIAFPFLYASGANDGMPWKVLYLDGAYRRFFRPTRQGIYYAAGWRYSYASGAEVLDRNVRTRNSVVEHRFGMYLGIGFRKFWRSGLYYGANVMIGRYVNDHIHHVGDSDMDTGPVILDSEILKIGFAF